MAELKTKPTKESVKKYLDSIKDKSRRDDCIQIAKMMEEAVGEKGIMWGASLVGFGKKKMKYATGREIDWLRAGFSSRKDSISLYLTCDLKQLKDELSKLGKHKTGVGCLYIKSLDDVDVKVLKKLIKSSLKLKY